MSEAQEGAGEKQAGLQAMMKALHRVRFWTHFPPLKKTCLFFVRDPFQPS